MAKFNETAKGSSKTTNLAGGEAFKTSPKLELVSILLTSFVQDQFYRTGDETVSQLTNLIDQISDKTFPAKAAIYARNEFGMRSISHVVAGELASRVKGEQWTKSFYDQVVRRPDDITEILSYYLSKNGKPVPNSLKKGLAQAFGKFDAYQLAKYRAEGKDISLVDVVNLVRPKPTEKNAEALKQLVAGTLKSADTWESKLSEAGQKAETDEDKDELKNQAWVELIKTKKIGYFALLRNLRNILEQSPESLPGALEMLVDEKLIKKSLVLPFRFLTALNVVADTNYNGAQSVLRALNLALDISVNNVPKFDGTTLIALDTSSSMRGQPSQIGALFASVLVKSNDGADLMSFSNDARYVTLNTADSTITVANSIPFLGGGTNFHSIFETANKVYDRVVLLSDMQAWIGYDSPAEAFNDYKKRTGANPRVYSFDLAGHGTMQFPEQNVYALAGFSEKVFDIMKLLEQDRNALVKKIEAIKL